MDCTRTRSPVRLFKAKAITVSEKVQTNSNNNNDNEKKVTVVGRTTKRKSIRLQTTSTIVAEKNDATKSSNNEKVIIVESLRNRCSLRLQATSAITAEEENEEGMQNNNPETTKTPTLNYGAPNASTKSHSNVGQVVKNGRKRTARVKAASRRLKDEAALLQEEANDRKKRKLSSLLEADIDTEPALIARIKGKDRRVILPRNDSNKVEDSVRVEAKKKSNTRKRKIATTTTCLKRKDPRVENRNPNTEHLRKTRLKQPVRAKTATRHWKDEGTALPQGENCSPHVEADRGSNTPTLLAQVNGRDWRVILPRKYGDDSMFNLEDRVRIAHEAIHDVWTSDEEAKTMMCPVESALLAHQYYMKHVPQHNPHDSNHRIRLLVLGESHATTMSEVSGLPQRSGNESDLHFGHLNLVHCLSYGEPQLLRYPVDATNDSSTKGKNDKDLEKRLQCQIGSINSGTPQFWKLLSTLAGELDDCDMNDQDVFNNAFNHLLKTVKTKTTETTTTKITQPNAVATPKRCVLTKQAKHELILQRNEQRVKNKANILKQLAERRIVFADVSPVSIYLSSGTITVESKKGNKYSTPRSKLSAKTRQTITRLAWDLYAAHLVRELQPQYLMILGSDIYTNLAKSGRLDEFERLIVGGTPSPPASAATTTTTTTTKLFPPMLHPSATQCWGGSGRTYFQMIQQYVATIVQDASVVVRKHDKDPTKHASQVKTQRVPPKQKVAFTIPSKGASHEGKVRSHQN
jgi:hypothetical protein